MLNLDSNLRVKLDGAAIGELRDLIVDAFDADDLQQLVKIKMDIDCEAVFERNAPKAKFVYDLLHRVEQEGRTSLLLRALLEARKNRADLRKVIAQHCPQALEISPSLHVQAQEVVDGLKQLQMQTEYQKVREVIVASRVNLDQLMEDIELLYNYKMLHDCLHIVQEQHYTLVDKVKQFRADPLTSAELEEELFNLQEITRKACKSADSLPDKALVRAQELDWIQKLESATADLSQSMNDLDAHGADTAVKAIRRVIRTEPFRINRVLTLIAEKIPLDELTLVIEKAIDVVATGETPAPELQKALLSLKSMLPQLRGRVAEHRQWQDIENDFWEAEDSIERQDNQQFTEFWPDLKSRVGLLVRTDPEAESAKAIKRHAAQIDQDLKGRVDLAMNDFKYFRKAGLHLFAQIDKALLGQCTAILEIRAPLRSLLNTIAVQ